MASGDRVWCALAGALAKVLYYRIVTSPRQHAGALQLWPERCSALEVDRVDAEGAGGVAVGRVVVDEDHLVG
eukprot:scaffold131184_cov60-Phaeocystis_antarctica.AAC.1